MKLFTIVLIISKVMAGFHAYLVWQNDDLVGAPPISLLSSSAVTALGGTIDQTYESDMFKKVYFPDTVEFDRISEALPGYSIELDGTVHALPMA